MFQMLKMQNINHNLHKTKKYIPFSRVLDFFFFFTDSLTFNQLGFSLRIEKNRKKRKKKKVNYLS